METRTDVGPSTSADPVPDHRPGVDDFVEPLLVDLAGLERGLLQGTPLSVRMALGRPNSLKTALNTGKA